MFYFLPFIIINRMHGLALFLSLKNDIQILKNQIENR
jgi:hypothetical protein